MNKITITKRKTTRPLSSSLVTKEVLPKQLRIFCTESLKKWSVKQSKSLSECLCSLKSQISFAIQEL
jgi:hypothetical protein